MNLYHCFSFGYIPDGFQEVQPTAYCPCSTTREATAMRSPRTAVKSSPRLPQLEKACMQQWRPNTAKKKKRTKMVATIHPILHALLMTWCCHSSHWGGICVPSLEPRRAFVTALTRRPCHKWSQMTFKFVIKMPCPSALLSCLGTSCHAVRKPRPHEKMTCRCFSQQVHLGSQPTGQVWMATHVSEGTFEMILALAPANVWLTLHEKPWARTT